MKYIIETRDIWELGQRDNQEDSLFPAHNEAKDSDRLFIVCDGMGGHASGEVASATVCEAMSQFILNNCPDAEGSFSDDNLRDAINAAFEALDSKDSNEVGKKKMGTTMTFLKLHNQGCTIAHMGDSRVYHVRPGKNVEETQILFQTRDHSLVNDLIKAGEITPEEAKTSNMRNVITRAMQPHMSYRPKAEIYHTNDILPGDYFMLCSDGILEQFEDEQIKFYFCEETGDIDEKISKLTIATQYNHDNHTAYLIRIVDVAGAIEPTNDIDNNNIINLSETNSSCDEIEVDIVDENTAPTNRTSRKRNPITFENKHIAIAITILIGIIFIFLLFKNCSNNHNNKKVIGEMVVTDTTTATEINKDNEKIIKQLEEEKKRAETKQLEAEKKAEQLQKELEKAQEKSLKDSLKAVKSDLKEEVAKAIKNVSEPNGQPDTTKQKKNTPTQQETLSGTMQSSNNATAPAVDSPTEQVEATPQDSTAQNP